MTQHDEAQPIRKSLLPCTPPPEWEFSTVYGAREEHTGTALFPGDTGPVVVRRRITYGDWEPVRPGHWADEPPTAADAVLAGQPTEPRPAWVDGDPLMEALASAVWEHCHTEQAPALVVDDPRNIAAAAATVARSAQPADRADLRDRIAAALAREDAHNAGYDHGFVGSYGADSETDGFVDAALAVLPPVDRAAILREAADRIDRPDLPPDFVDQFDSGAHWATAELRRMAAEAQPAQPQTDEAQHTGGNAEDCPLCRPEIDKTVLYPWICPGAPQPPAQP
ncbi:MULTISPECIES: hypothetical protein [Streptomyces]|uniref:Uncharacterized protein n=2 Tax=Streptomyces TaxID=1883 RepID=A0A2U9NZ26_STRAS|nr:hypothetical protein [Streptomyces actuosus]AWT42596.1 hypothetical protein DMT42_09900 [Streptomyces actuosus]MBM4819808.1 hypothetical protein [Streptomyces actuosus]